MPAQKDFKRLVRSRMRKTGESYTAARAQLLNRKPAAPRSSRAAPAPDYEKLAGFSNAAVKARTGCDWSRWVWALDRLRAHERSHGEIARLVHEKYKVPGWWSQAVTTGYERIKGRREIGQRVSGDYEASKSKTLAVPVSRVFKAFKDARTRARWLPDTPVTIRTAHPNKTLRLGWADGTIVSVYFAPKPARRSQVAIQHQKLKTRARVTELKAFWSARLAALERVLTA